MPVLQYVTKNITPKYAIKEISKNSIRHTKLTFNISRA